MRTDVPSQNILLYYMCDHHLISPTPQHVEGGEGAMTRRCFSREPAWDMWRPAYILPLSVLVPSAWITQNSLACQVALSEQWSSTPCKAALIYCNDTTDDPHLRLFVMRTLVHLVSSVVLASYMSLLTSSGCCMRRPSSVTLLCDKETP